MLYFKCWGMFMKDFSKWDEYEGVTEGSGRSEKIWLQDSISKRVGLFKFKKDIGTTDHISECIAYQLACLIDVPCAEFELGTYKGREGSMSYGITADKESLIEGINYILKIYPEYDMNNLKDRASDKVYSLEMIKESIENYIKFDDFLVIPIFDYLIGNTDRHQNNWAIIYDGIGMHLSPLYDNSSSLCAYMKETDLKACLGNDKMKWLSVVETKSKSVIRIKSTDKKKPTHLQVLQYICENFYEETRDLVSRIIARVNEKNIDIILEPYSDDQLSSDRKRVIKKYLLHKVDKLREVYFEKENNDVDQGTA